MSVNHNLEQYSIESQEGHEDGKEVERVWYSTMGCWYSGTWHFVSSEMLIP